MDYTNLSIEELQAKRIEVHQQITNLNDELSNIARTYDVKIRETELSAKISSMSPEERETLQRLLAMPTNQTVVTTGIESELEVSPL
jgi:acyl-CoA thioesterase FadM